MKCTYHLCHEAAAVIATVLSGDADEMHETNNPLCFGHMYMVSERWLRELAAGGPVRRYTMVRAEQVPASPTLGWVERQMRRDLY